MAGVGFTRSGPGSPNRRGLAALAATALMAAAASAWAADAPIQVQPLAAPDLFSIGASQGELPADLWSGASGELARTVIPALPSRPLSPAAAGLARRVLSAAAPGPSGVGDDPELAGQRALALLTLGEARAAAAIAERTPGLAQKPTLSQAAAEAALILGEEDKACAIGEALASNRDGLFWLRLRAFCQARAGQAAPAQLTLDLADQQQRSADLDRLMGAMMAGRDAGAPVLDNALDFAVSRHAAADWAKGLASAAAPIAVAVARDAGAPPSARLEAAARALRFGIAVPDAFSVVQPPPIDIASADLPGAAGQGALMALAASTSDLTMKEAALLELFKRAETPAAFVATARMARAQISQIMGANPVLRDPRVFALAAAAAGDAQAARAARAQIPQGADLVTVDAMIAIAAEAPEPPAAPLPPIPTALVGALGAPLSPEARLALAGAELGAAKAPAGRLQALQLAAEAGRVGDTALHVLAMAMDAPGPLERVAMVRALRLVGLRADARAFAVEALLTP